MGLIYSLSNYKSEYSFYMSILFQLIFLYKYKYIPFQLKKVNGSADIYKAENLDTLTIDQS